MAKLVKKGLFLVVVVIMSCCMFMLAGCDLNSSDDETSDVVRPIELNQWGALNDFQIRVVSIENTAVIQALTGNPYTTQNNFMCILIEVKNVGKYSRSISYSSFEVSNGSSTFDSKGTEAYWYAEKNKRNLYPALYLNGSLDAGLSGKYYLVFETPSSGESDSYTLVYEYGFNKIEFALEEEEDDGND